MRILDHYVLKSIVTIFLGTVFTFAFLFILIDTFGNLEDFIEKQVPLMTIGQYYLSFLPMIIVNTSTVACLIAVLFSYSQLNSHNEVIAIRASGVNFWQIAKPAIIFSIVVSAFVFWMNEKFVPQSSMVAQDIRESKIKIGIGEKGKGRSVIKNLTLYGLKNRLFFVDEFDPNTNELTGITIIGHDDHQNLKEKISALKGKWTGLAWKFYNCQITSYQDARPNVPSEVRIAAEKLMDLKETPQDLLRQRLDINTMNLKQLHDYIGRFSGSGAVKTINNLTVDYYQKITLPLRPFIIVLVGLPFALLVKGRQRGMTFAAVGIALIIGFLYYVTDAVGLALGKGGATAPVVGAFLAPVLFLIVAFVLMIRRS